MKLRLPVVIISLLITNKSYSQDAVEKTEFRIDNVTVQLSKYQFVKEDQVLCEVSNSLKLIMNGKQIFHEKICTAELADVKIITRGYLTVVEHYSSSVGWSQFYVFDFCKMRLLLTNKLQESPGLPWESFIDLRNDFKTQYIEKVIQLN
jgi:hypothetical protein